MKIENDRYWWPLLHMNCSVGMIKDQELRHVTSCADVSNSNQPETRKIDWQDE